MKQMTQTFHEHPSSLSPFTSLRQTASTVRQWLLHRWSLPSIMSFHCLQVSEARHKLLMSSSLKILTLISVGRVSAKFCWSGSCPPGIMGESPSGLKMALLLLLQTFCISQQFQFPQTQLFIWHNLWFTNQTLLFKQYEGYIVRVAVSVRSGQRQQRESS